jgi:Lrp/AsnC family transcriptional regulator
MREPAIDNLDRRILELLQVDATLAAQEVADRVGLSKAACWRRIQRLQSEGIIRHTVALVDPRAVNLGTTAFVTIKAGTHSAAWFERFMAAVADIPEIMEIYRMSGEVDYLMRIVVPDIEGYDVVYRKLIGAVECLDVSASFALEVLRSNTALPLDHVRRAEGGR